jgi:autotransporter-associated beta strand protein
MENGGVTMGAGGLIAGGLNMTGGVISPAGAGALTLVGSNVQATSSLSESAAITSPLLLENSQVINVSPGGAPELQVTGVIGEEGGQYGITKTGGGTMLMTANNSYAGATTISEGKLIVNGSQGGAFSVGQGGTLTGLGTVGTTNVEGVLAPTAPGLSTGSLSFGPSGRFDATLSSVAPATVPSVIATGSVTINPSAVLNLVVEPGTSLPHASSVLLINNKGSGVINGTFSGIPNGFELSTSVGVPLVANYAGGDGNDLSFTADTLPRINAISATPSSAVVGQAVSLNVSASDADSDSLTTTWNFGDGTTGTGAATSHVYAKTGTYVATATVSDGIGQVHSSVVVIVATVTIPPPPAPAATKPVNTSKPTIKGKAKIKSKLTAGTGTFTGTAPIVYKYQWESCVTKKHKKKSVTSCKTIKGATKSSFTVGKQYKGKSLEVVVTATNVAGSASASSKLTAVIKK